MIIGVWGLSLCFACSLLFEEPAHQGGTIVIREAQEPEIISYPSINAQAEEAVKNEAKPSLKPEQAPAKLVAASEDDVSQDLRRQRIPLRRNRYMLLEQQNLSTNLLQN